MGFALGPGPNRGQDGTRLAKMVATKGYRGRLKTAAINNGRDKRLVLWLLFGMEHGGWILTDLNCELACHMERFETFGFPCKTT